MTHKIIFRLRHRKFYVRTGNRWRATSTLSSLLSARQFYGPTRPHTPTLSSVDFIDSIFLQNYVFFLSNHENYDFCEVTIGYTVWCHILCKPWFKIVFLAKKQVWLRLNRVFWKKRKFFLESVLKKTDSKFRCLSK